MIPPPTNDSKTVVAMWSDLKQQPYDLPASFRSSTAVILFLIYFTVPYESASLPVKFTYAVAVLVYFIHRSVKWKRPNELGISLHMTPGAKKAVAALLVLAFLITPLALIGMHYALESERAQISHDGGIPPAEAQLSYAQMNMPDPYIPPDDIYRALADKDLHKVLLLSWKSITGVIFAIPAIETIFVFGLLLPALWKKYNCRRGIILVALIFGVMHLPTGLYQIIKTSLTGLLMAFLYSRTKSLYPAILLHVWLNGISYAFATVYNWGLPFLPG